MELLKLIDELFIIGLFDMFVSSPDVIFFIYLYQRYIYSVDPKRVNEFGTSQEMLETKEEITDDKKVKEENGSVKQLEEKKNN